MNSTKFIDICFPDNDLPEIILAGRFNIGDRNHSPVYCQPDFALHLYFYNATMRLDGTEINLSPGDMTLTPANSRTTYCLPDPPGMHYCAHFSTPKGNQNMMQLPCYIPASRRNRGAATYFEDIIELLQINTTVAHRAANETLKLLLLQLAMGIGVHREASSKLERKLDSVSQIIEKDLDGEMTTKKLARITGFNYSS